MELKKRLAFAVLVGLTVMVADMMFHLFFVFPFESLGYFGAKLLFAFLVGAFLADASLWIGAAVGGLVFTGLMSLWYYLAYITYDPTLSSCVLPPTYNCTIPGVSQAVLFTLGGYPVEAVTIIEGVVHFLWFLIFFTFYKWVLSD